MSFLRPALLAALLALGILCIAYGVDTDSTLYAALLCGGGGGMVGCYVAVANRKAS